MPLTRVIFSGWRHFLAVSLTKSFLPDYLLIQFTGGGNFPGKCRPLGTKRAGQVFSGVVWRRFEKEPTMQPESKKALVFLSVF